MICRRCGNRIPEHLTTRESFQCPACGRQFGTPREDRSPRAAYEPRPLREPSVSRAPARPAPQPQRRAPQYDDRRNEPYYDEPYYDEPPYGGRDMRREPRTMKLGSLLYVFIAAVVTLIIVACVAAGISGNPEESKPTNPPTQISTTPQPAGTESPYPVV